MQYVSTVTTRGSNGYVDQKLNSVITLPIAQPHIGWIRLQSLIFFVPRCRWHPLILLLSHKHTHSSSTSHCAASAVAIVISTMNTANKDYHSDSSPYKHTHTADINTIHHMTHERILQLGFIHLFISDRNINKVHKKKRHRVWEKEGRIL